MVFGMEGESPVPVAVPGGRVVLFRGRADRVDRAEDGTLIVVDLKTGSKSAFKDLGEEDPVAGGTKLQLPVYAYAARQRYGTADTPVEAAYWFVRRDRGAWVSLPLTPAVGQVYAETLGVIADGIAGGVFPQRPSRQPGWGFVDCPYCDPDGLGHKEARARWERKRDDPALSAYTGLTEPDTLDHAGSLDDPDSLEDPDSLGDPDSQAAP
jgi:RecB family exonuclease